MLVQAILKNKGDSFVVTIAPGSTVQAAAELLAARRIGAVVVSDDGRWPLGILSERDIVRELGSRGQICLADTADRIMTADVTTCTRSDSAESVLERMTAGRFRHMPVVEAGAMIGLISIGDVVAARLAELAMEKDALEGMIKGF